MNKKILASLILIGLLAAAAGIGTWAYFSSTRTMNPGFYTASLDLELNARTPWNVVLDNMAPGDDCVQIFDLISHGTIDGSYSELEISYEVPMPTIDGVLEDREWGCRMEFRRDDIFTVYVKNDLEYLYVGFKTLGGTYLPTGDGEVGMMNLYAMNPDTWESWAYCWIHRTPELIELYHSDPDRHKDPTSAVFAVTDTVFELKVPLSELTSISIGDTMAFHFLSYAEGWTDWTTCWLHNQEYILRGDIGEVITVKVEEWQSSWVLLSEGYTLKEWVGAKLKILEGSDGVGAIKITLHFEESAGNEYQSICGNIDFTFTLWQGP